MTKNYFAVSFDYGGKTYGFPLVSTHMNEFLNPRALKERELIPKKAKTIYLGPNKDEAEKAVAGLGTYRDLFRDLPPEKQLDPIIREKGLLKGLIALVNASA